VKAVAEYVAGSRAAPAVVCDVAWVNGLAAIRSLGRAGAPVIALDHRRGALGFKSRYALGLRCPDPASDEDRFVEFLAELGDALGRPAPIIPTHDEPLNAIARGRERLGERFLYPFPGWETLAPMQKKRSQVERAQELGVPVPATRHPETAAEARAAADAIGYPVLVKPSEPTGFKRRFHGKQAFRCESGAEVEANFELAREHEPMVQELIPGDDDELYMLGSYLAADGEALGLFSGRKLLQTPPGIGTCRIGEAIWVDGVVEQGLRLLRGFGFHGLSQVEFKRDPRDGVFKLMEVNARLWQWHGLAIACGVDLPRMAYWDLLGQRLPAARSNGSSKRWAITLFGGTRPVLLRPPYVDAVFARDDPVPALAQAARALRRGFR
jgi:D-aspartate ligase